MKLKNRIKELREQRGLTQNQLAQMSFTTQNTISSLETGKYGATAKMAAMICLVLNVKFEECFYFDFEEEK